MRFSFSTYFSHASGFTLIEILIIIALLSAFVLGLIATIDPFEQLKKGADTSLSNASTDVYNAIILSYTSHGTMPFTSDVSEISLSSQEGQNIIHQLEQSGDLKKNFSTLAADHLDSLYVTASTDGQTLSICFQPESKSYKNSLQDSYDKSGAVTDCQQNSCYICIGQNSSPIARETQQTTKKQCKTLNSECQINSSEKSCCDGLICVANNASSDNGKCFTVYSSPTPTTHQSPTPTPRLSVTPSPTPQVNNSCIAQSSPTIPAMAFTGFTYDQQPQCADGQSTSTAFRNSIILENGLELFKMEHGYYPDCNCESWADTEQCLQDKISQYIHDFPVSGDLYPYIYQPYNKINGTYQSYCLAERFPDGCGSINYSCPLNGQQGYTYYRKGRGEVIWRPNGNSLSQSQKTENDTRRKNDLNQIKRAIENFKTTNGYIPQTTYENSPGTVLALRSSLQPLYINPLPLIVGTSHAYSLTEWSPNAEGKFQKYCLASYMDDSTNCSNSCSTWVPFYNAYHCYGVGN